MYKYFSDFPAKHRIGKVTLPSGQHDTSVGSGLMSPY